jgi:myo-inositol 2-dehydrogenase/D-chiro-inositol 1-dehydrogenase
MSIESLSHDIDLMRWMFGDVRDVCATTFESRPAVPGFDDNAHALLAFESGVTAMIHASWSSHLTMSSRGIVGTRGTAYLEGPALFDNAALHWKTDETPHEVVELINDPNDINGFINENRHFLEVVDRGVTPQVTGADGLRALEVSHAILQSSRENRKVEIKEYSQGGQNE